MPNRGKPDTEHSTVRKETETTGASYADEDCITREAELRCSSAA